MNKTEKITLSAITLAALALLILFGRASEAEIARCQEATNYSAERCLHEIMR